MPLDTDGASYILQKLRSIIIPVIDFEDTSVEEAIDFLRQRSIELDTLELDPDPQGDQLRDPQAAKLGGGGDAGLDAGTAASGCGLGGDPGSARINELRLRNVPLATVLNYICDATRLRYKVDDFAVTIVPATETERGSVHPHLQRAAGLRHRPRVKAVAAAAVARSIPSLRTAGGGSALKPRRIGRWSSSRTRACRSRTGATASFNAGTSTLVVRNTPTNLDLVERLGGDQQIADAAADQDLDQVRRGLPGEHRRTRASTGSSLRSVWAANSVFLGGGTIGNGQARTNADFISPVNGTTIPGIPAGTRPDTVTNIVTGGNRSGDGAITRNRIDAILNNPNRTRAERQRGSGHPVARPVCSPTARCR